MNTQVQRTIPAFFTLFCLVLMTLGCGLSSETEPQSQSGASSESESTPKNVEVQAFDEAAPPANLTAENFEEEKAPATYQAEFTVKDKGKFVIEVTRAWSPRGADRFYNLVKSGFYNHAPLFRVVQNFMIQFGIPAWPEVNAVWQQRNILDDHEVTSANKAKQNKRGSITFACGGPDTRVGQVFINFVNNHRLNVPAHGGVFTPFGSVIEGMDIVDSIYKGYGEMKSQGGRTGIDARALQAMGLPYIQKNFPLMDIIEQARIK